jgi:hypothetical protein
MSCNSTDTEVFVYTGEGGASIPHDVVRVRVDPSVTSIPHAFSGRNKLVEVELCEGLVEIGEYAFYWCNHSIAKINFPNSLRRINDQAFYNSLRVPFVSTMALKALENAHSHTVSSPTLEFLPSSL